MELVCDLMRTTHMINLTYIKHNELIHIKLDFNVVIIIYMPGFDGINDSKQFYSSFVLFSIASNSPAMHPSLSAEVKPRCQLDL